MLLDESEPLLSLNDVPKLTWLPNRRGGKRLNIVTVWRWATKGLRARDGTRVKLETCKVANSLATSESAVRRFFAALTEHDPVCQTAAPPRSPTARQKASARAAKILESKGI